MATAERSIEVQVPLETAYNQWTQFESFPVFMEGVKAVQQLDAKRLHWTADIGGKVEEWDAEITEQMPDTRIAWRSTSGAPNAGVVTFHHISADVTRVMLQLEFEPHTALEHVGTALGFVDRRVAGDLARFKQFIERQGSETGSWRGAIQDHSTGAPIQPTQP